MTIKCEVNYSPKLWSNVSEESQDLVRRKVKNIIDILLKDPEKRMKLKEILKHSWILMDSSSVKDIRSNSVSNDNFRAFSLTGSYLDK